MDPNYLLLGSLEYLLKFANAHIISLTLHPKHSGLPLTDSSERAKALSTSGAAVIAFALGSLGLGFSAIAFAFRAAMP